MKVLQLYDAKIESCRGYIGIMEIKMETTVLGLGFRFPGTSWKRCVGPSHDRYASQTK